MQVNILLMALDTFASTCLNELEYDGDAIELQLSHAPSGVRGVYNNMQRNYLIELFK